MDEHDLYSMWLTYFIFHCFPKTNNHHSLEGFFFLSSLLLLTTSRVWAAVTMTTRTESFGTFSLTSSLWARSSL